MDKLIDLLREAFEAGQSSAIAYYHGAHDQSFQDWRKDNEKEINSCTDFNIRKALESSDHELFHLRAHMDELYNWIKSDSVLKAFHYIDKNPTAFDMEDDDYVNLYLLCRQLRKKDREYNEMRLDDFDQKLP